MRVLFIGLGSIGTRNLRAFQAMRPNYTYAALRSSATSSSSSELSIHFFFSSQEASDFQADLVCINTPTYLHGQSIEIINSKPRAVFLEKPLSHSTDDLQKIKTFFHEIKSIFFYGCIFRHHPLIKKVYQILQSERLGKPLSYHLYCGSYLPDWRPGRKYQETYSAKRELGGGASFDLIHEFDMAEYWFGPVEKIAGFKTKISDLEITSDDLCLAQIRHANAILGSVELNYFRKKSRRDFEIVCTNGTLRGDLLTGVLCVEHNDSAMEETTHTIDRDSLHQAQAEAIFSYMEQNSASPWNINEAISLNQKIIDLPFIQN